MLTEPPPRTERVPGPNKVQAPAPEAQILFFGEIAFLLRVSVSTVRTMVGRGDLTAIRINTCLRVTRDDLDAFIKRSRVTFIPGSAADPAQVAAERARKAQERKAMVVADWNTGKDYFNDDAPPRPRTKKTKMTGGVQ